MSRDGPTLRNVVVQDYSVASEALRLRTLPLVLFSARWNFEELD